MRLKFVPIIAVLLAASSLSATAKSDFDPIGVWNIEIAAPDGTTKDRVATFTNNEDSIKGSLYNPDRDVTLDLVVVTDESENKIRFSLNYQGYSVSYAGSIKEGGLNGRVYYEINGRKFDTDFSAKRQADPSDLPGASKSTHNRK